MKSEFFNAHRLFVAEFDFAKYFDTVDHTYLLQTMDRMRIIRTPLEDFLIRSFLKAPEPTVGREEYNRPRQPRTVGLPQGTSISLFLANVAAAELDQQVERLGVGFVRYADDTVLWSKDYGRLCTAGDVLHEAADQIGSSIHASKSPGIHLLIKEDAPPAEISEIREIKYLGHALALRATRIRIESVAKIKRRVLDLLFNNLLREPLAGSQKASRLSDMDRDYVTFIWQLRRYLYGSLSENQIRRFQSGSIPAMSFEGVMSFFPLIDDDDQLVSLDGWLSSQTWMAMNKRRRLLAEAALPTPLPLGLPRERIIGFQSVSGRTKRNVDLRLPSFCRIASVVRAAVRSHGVGVASSGAFGYLYD